MLIRRECLDQVGLFDETAFGHGYGEENDFCLRAEARGWQHVAATDTFVWHWGGTSFADQRTPRVAEAMRTIARMHPTYLKRIADYIEANPLAAVRQALDIARLRRAAPGYLLTDAPGAAKPRAREGVLLMRPDGSGPGLLLSAPGVKLTPNLPVLNPALDFGATVDALRAIGVTGIAVPGHNGTAGRNRGAAAPMRGVSRRQVGPTLTRGVRTNTKTSRQAPTPVHRREQRGMVAAGLRNMPPVQRSEPADAAAVAA